MTRTLVGTPDPEQPRPGSLADTHAERAVLGALISYGRTAPHLAAILAPDDFCLPHHRAVFAAAAGLIRSNRSCDPLTLTSAFRRQPIAAEADALPMDVLTGGLVHELAAAAPVEATAVHYAAIVRELGALRRHTTRTAPGSSEIIPEFPLRGFLVDEDDT